MTSAINESSIDAVVLWVDGEDPSFRLRLLEYLPQLDSTLSSEEISPARFFGSDDIDLCLLSILTNAPFFRFVHVVVDSQRPVLTRCIKYLQPNLLRKIRFVDHIEIFRGFESFLPVFNSLAIETLLHRIPGLAQSYVYFNDDFFLLRPCSPKHFFVSGRPVSRGYLVSKKSPFVRYDLYKAQSSRTVGFVAPMVNALSLLSTYSNRSFVRLYHSPYTFSRLTMELFFDKNQDAILSNISHRFRSPSQFSTASLSATLEYLLYGNYPFSLFRHVYLKPASRFPGYSFFKLLPCLVPRLVLFGCVQSLSMADSSIVSYLQARLERLIFMG